MSAALSAARRWSRRWITLGMCVVAGSLLLMVSSSLYFDRVTAWHDQVKLTGVKVRGEVKRIDSPGWTSKSGYWVTVDVATAPPFTWRFKPFDDRKYREGQIIDVWYDPADKRHIRSEWDTNETPREIVSMLATIGSFIALIVGAVRLRSAVTIWRKLRRPVLTAVERVGSRKALVGGKHYGSFAIVEAAEGVYGSRFVPPSNQKGWVSGSGRARVFLPWPAPSRKSRPWIMRRPRLARTTRRWLVAVRPRARR